MRVFGLIATVCGASLLLCLQAPALGQSGSITQDEHDKQIRADTERNTKYHNNANDYPVNQPSTTAPHPPSTWKPPVGPTAAELEYAASASGLGANEVANFRSWMADAQKGDTRAMSEVAQDYYYGSGVKKDKDLAYQWFTGAAPGYPFAEYCLAKMLIDGDGRTPEVERGYTMMSHAAERGAEQAKKFLVERPYRKTDTSEFPSMLMYGDEVFAEHKASFAPMPEKYMKQVFDKPKKAETGDFVRIGDMYLWGNGVPQDTARAREAYKLAYTAQGSSDELPISEAWLAWHDRAADPAAAYAVMMSLVGEKKTGEGRYLAALAACGLQQPVLQRKYLVAAKESEASSHPPGQALVDLAVMKMQGEGGAPMDDVLFDLQVAVAGHNRNAEYILSRLYAQGSHGVEKDPGIAQKLLQAAANHGQPNAQKALIQTEKASAR